MFTSECYFRTVLVFSRLDVPSGRLSYVHSGPFLQDTLVCCLLSVHGGHSYVLSRLSLHDTLLYSLWLSLYSSLLYSILTVSTWNSSKFSLFSHKECSSIFYPDCSCRACSWMSTPGCSGRNSWVYIFLAVIALQSCIYFSGSSCRAFSFIH